MRQAKRKLAAAAVLSLVVAVGRAGPIGERVGGLDGLGYLGNLGGTDLGSSLGNLGSSVAAQAAASRDLSLPTPAEGLTASKSIPSVPDYGSPPSYSGGGSSGGGGGGGDNSGDGSSASEWEPSSPPYVKPTLGAVGGGGGSRPLRRAFAVAVCVSTDVSDGCEDLDVRSASEALALAYLTEFVEGRAFSRLRVRFPAAWEARHQMEDAIKIEQQALVLAVRLLRQNTLQLHFTWFDPPQVAAAKTFLARYDSAQRDSWARAIVSSDWRPTTVTSTRSTKTIQIPSGIARAQAYLINDTKQWRGQ